MKISDSTRLPVSNLEGDYVNANYTIYRRNEHESIYFFQKVFKENARDFSPLGKDSDILNILENYITDGNFWCLINEKMLFAELLRCVNSKTVMKYVVSLC